MTLVPIDPSNEASVVTLLERAAQWLAEAVHRGEPGEVALMKAQLATAAEATKQLNLSKDIQLDAQEMVRRAEYALGRAIRRGQADGTIAKPGDIGGVGTPGVVGSLPGSSRRNAHLLARPSDFAAKHELSPGANQPGIYALADHAEPEEFEAALAEAKAEGNPSRANVVRKIKGQPFAGVITRDMRAEVIRNLAEQGYSSRQMPERVGVSEESIRQIARDFDIEIPADKVVAGTRRTNHTEVMENFVTKVENTVSAFQYIDLNEVEFNGQADDWVASLAASISTLTRIKKQIAKEATRV